MSDNLPTGSNYETLLAQYRTLLAENKRLRKALEKAVTYIELVADDTDGEERAEARGDLAFALAALSAAKGER